MSANQASTFVPLCVGCRPQAWSTLCLNPVRDEYGLQANLRQLPRSVQQLRQGSHRCRSKQGNDSLPWEKAPRGAHPAVVPEEAEGCLSRGLPEELYYLLRPQAEELLLRPPELAQ